MTSAMRLRTLTISGHRVKPFFILNLKRNKKKPGLYDVHCDPIALLLTLNQN